MPKKIVAPNACQRCDKKGLGSSMIGAIEEFAQEFKNIATAIGKHAVIRKRDNFLWIIVLMPITHQSRVQYILDLETLHIQSANVGLCGILYAKIIVNGQ